MTTLEQNRKKIEVMQIEFNILKLETRYLELDEEKVKIKVNIQKHQQQLEELKK